MSKPADRLGELLNLLTDAKLAGTRGFFEAEPEDNAAFGKAMTYAFRSNEQAAKVAVMEVEGWLEDRRPRVLKVDWDDSALVEELAEILRDAESEWRNEVEVRDEYGPGQRFAYAAERVIEELRKG